MSNLIAMFIDAFLRSLMSGTAPRRPSGQRGAAMFDTYFFELMVTLGGVFRVGRR
jgi:hypothetical protein